MRPRSWAVTVSTVPDGVSRMLVWYAATARAVAGPYLPSAPPATATPAAMREFCRARTESPECPVAMTTCAETEIDDPGVAAGAAAGAGAGGDAGAAGADVVGRETAGAPGTMPRAMAVVMSTTPDAASERLD